MMKKMTERRIRDFYGIFLLCCLCSAAIPVPGGAQTGIKTNLFTEVYDETIRFKREGKNTITMAQALEGARLTIPRFSFVDIYAKQRFGGDANRDFWNNRGEFILGTRVRLLKKVSLTAFYEYVYGQYLDVGKNGQSHAQNPAFEDRRYGLFIWQEWDAEIAHRWTPTIPMTFWDEIYADLVQYRSEENNIIGYLNARAGARIMRINKTVLDFYLVTYQLYDKNGFYWNNRNEIGLGLRIKPHTGLQLCLFFEILKGNNILRSGKYENPNDPIYEDVRFGLLFWRGWGM
jgi:hypothetical protein